MSVPANGVNGTGTNIRQDLEDLLSSTVLTREVDFSGSYPTQTSGAGSGGGSSPTRLVDSTIRQILGYRPRPGDTKGFVSALNSVFVEQGEDGYSEFIYKPRTYSAEVQADFGALTGAQASLFSRAKAGLDQALPLLDGIYPLRSDADPQDCEAVRATVKMKLTELVSELGILGGPRNARVDNYFVVLIGSKPYTSATPVLEQLAQQPFAALKDMKAKFGFSANQVNDIREEQNLTNFLILVDTVVALQANWQSVRASFSRIAKPGQPTEKFFGTQLVLISQQLAVISEAVQELYFAMDSVFLGPAERQTVLLEYAALAGYADLDPITIGELFDWVSSTVANEMPMAIEQSGKEGLIALYPTIELLGRYVTATTILSGTPSSNLTPKFHTARVHRSLQNLDKIVSDAVELTEKITRFGPQLNFAKYENNVLTLCGSGFHAPDEIQFSGAVDLTGTPIASVPINDKTIQVLPTSKTIQVSVPGLFQGERGPVTVRVFNADRQPSNTVDVERVPALPGVPIPTASIEVDDFFPHRIVKDHHQKQQDFFLLIQGENVDLLTNVWLLALQVPNALTQDPPTSAKMSHRGGTSVQFHLDATKLDPGEYLVMYVAANGSVKVATPQRTFWIDPPHKV